MIDGCTLAKSLTCALIHIQPRVGCVIVEILVKEDCMASGIVLLLASLSGYFIIAGFFVA